MKAHILGSGDVPTEVLDLAPDCNDYCDECGDCLYCFFQDPCGAVDGKPHAWVVYPEQAADFKERMGLSAAPVDLGEDQP